MRYSYDDMHNSQFEALIVEICTELLGEGVQGFAQGPDGGRDGKFTGTANCYPSSNSPLSGTTIIQAKHTIESNAKFSDPDFSGKSDSSVISKEIRRITALNSSHPFDNYLLFSNRRLGANAHQSICDRIAIETGVHSVYIHGVEDLDRYIKRYAWIANSIREFDYDSPLRASPDDFANVITAIASTSSTILSEVHENPEDLRRVPFEEKNKINGLSEEYASMIIEKYLRHFGAIERFLTDPMNDSILRSYQDAVAEFRAKLIAYKNDYPSYDKLLDKLLTVLIARDSDLKRHKRLTRTVFYYMYWCCDIGTVKGEMGQNNA